MWFFFVCVSFVRMRMSGLRTHVSCDSNKEHHKYIRKKSTLLIYLVFVCRFLLSFALLTQLTKTHKYCFFSRSLLRLWSVDVQFNIHPRLLNSNTHIIWMNFCRSSCYCNMFFSATIFSLWNINFSKFELQVETKTHIPLKQIRFVPSTQREMQNKSPRNSVGITIICETEQRDEFFAVF